MQSTSISKHYNELDEYTQITDYISKVLDNFNDIEKIDSNDIYEIVYAKKLCESKLHQGIENDGTRKAYEDTLNRITLITDLLNDDILSNAMKNPLDIQKVKKINESRHAKLNKSPKIKDKSQPIIDSPLKSYMIRILPKIFMLMMLSVLMIFGRDIGTKVASALISTDPNVTEATKEMMIPVDFVLNLMVLIMFTVTALGLTLDLAYIAFPFVREMIGPNRYGGEAIVSDAAKDAVEYSGSVIGYNYSDISDKVNYSSNLLNTVIDELKNSKNRGNKTTETHIGYLTKLRNKVRDSKEGIDKINYLADAEIYYLNNKEYFNELLGDETL